MLIATIYNDAEDVRLGVYWDPESTLITYLNLETREEMCSDEHAETIDAAIDDTYSRYAYGWDLQFVEEAM